MQLQELASAYQQYHIRNSSKSNKHYNISISQNLIQYLWEISVWTDIWWYLICSQQSQQGITVTKVRRRAGTRQHNITGMPKSGGGNPPLSSLSGSCCFRWSSGGSASKRTSRLLLLDCSEKPMGLSRWLGLPALPPLLSWTPPFLLPMGTGSSGGGDGGAVALADWIQDVAHR